MITAVKKEAEAWAEAFADLERDDLHDTRREAFARFAAHGYPTFREEAWKFTPLNLLSRHRFERVVESAHKIDRSLLRRLCYGEFACTELVFVDGRFEAGLSAVDALPAGAVVSSLADALRTRGALVREHLPEMGGGQPGESPLSALNAAFMQDGAFVFLPRDTALSGPVHLLFVTTARETPVAVHPRNLVIAEAGSRVDVVETYVSEGGTYFTNAVTDVYVGENARVDHYKLQRESKQAFHIAGLRVHLSRAATFRSFFISTGGRLVRNEIYAPLAAEGVTCKMFGLYLADGEQHVDCHTVIDHAKPNCSSEQIYKGILDGKSRGVFSGTVVVDPDAQKTDARQSNKNLLLSEESLINSRPQMQIHADDVKCTHGVAIGSLDETQLFYLRSRGIGVEEARDILTYAFASELLSRIDIDAVRADVERRISEGLAADSEEHRGITE